jgi:hypothetical protein
MITLTARVTGLFLAGLAWAGTNSHFAFGAVPLRSPAVPQGPLSPEMIVEKNITGKATVEFLVDEVYLLPESWAVSANDRWKAVPLHIVPKNAGKSGAFYKMSVIISGQVVSRFKQLGIKNPAEHFRGKVLRVTGTLTSQEKRAGTFYRLEVTNLDQLQVIASPTTLANPLSPQMIVDKKMTGKATIEFSVGDVDLIPSWSETSLQIVPKDFAQKKWSHGRVSVLVSGDVIHRLWQLGIDDVEEHFRGKVLRVSGTIKRIEKRSGPEYRLEVANLDQLEAIRMPFPKAKGE